MRVFGAVAVATGLLLAPLASAADFGRPAEIPLGNQPDSVFPGDATQDGTADIVTTQASSSSISVLPGRGDGSFEPRIDYKAVTGARSAVFGDWDADGVDDFALAAGATITVFAGVDGGLARQASYPAHAPAALAAADLDNDGNLDLVAASSTGATVSVLRGRGDETFDPAVDYPIGSQASSVVVTDLNGDYVPDIAAAGASLSILFGIGDGAFEPYAGYASGPGARSIDADDLDGDADTDLVVAGGQNQVRVLLNAGDGTFPDLVSYQVGGTPVGVSLADVDDDGNFDVLSANRGSNDVSILPGVGDGTFRAQSRVKVGRTPTALGILDLNADGANDLVVSNRGSKSVTVLLNGADAPQPTVCLVPRVARRTLAAARGLVTRAHCTLAPVRRKYSNRIKRGRVIAQSPVPGTRLPEGSRVTLLLSRGPRR